jgi:hypothetical protein
VHHEHGVWRPSAGSRFDAKPDGYAKSAGRTTRGAKNPAYRSAKGETPRVAGVFPILGTLLNLPRRASVHHRCITRLRKKAASGPGNEDLGEVEPHGCAKIAIRPPPLSEAQKGVCLMRKMTQPSHRRTRGTSVWSSSHGVGCSDATRCAPATRAVADAPWTQRSAFAPRPREKRPMATGRYRNAQERRRGDSD